MRQKSLGRTGFFFCRQGGGGVSVSSPSSVIFADAGAAGTAMAPAARATRARRGWVMRRLNTMGPSEPAIRPPRSSTSERRLAGAVREERRHAAAEVLGVPQGPGHPGRDVVGLVDAAREVRAEDVLRPRVALRRPGGEPFGEPAGALGELGLRVDAV